MCACNKCKQGSILICCLFVWVGTWELMGVLYTMKTRIVATSTTWALRAGECSSSSLISFIFDVIMAPVRGVRCSRQTQSLKFLQTVSWNRIPQCMCRWSVLFNSLEASKYFNLPTTSYPLTLTELLEFLIIFFSLTTNNFNPPTKNGRWFSTAEGILSGL